MKKRWGAVLGLAAVLLASVLVTGCAEKDVKPQKPEKTYVKWMKVADGTFHPFRMPEYMGTKGLFLQRMGWEQPEDIYFADVKESGASLSGSGFDLSGEREKAKALLAARERDVSGMTELFLPKRNALLIQVNAPELWLYHIESGVLELLGDGGYTGMPYEDIHELAVQKRGEEAYLYPYSGPCPSPGERWIAFGSTLSEVGGGTGAEVYLYDMSEKAERRLLTGESAGDSWQLKGWVGEELLLCVREQSKMEDGANRGTQSRQAYVVSPDGQRTELDVLDGFDPNEPHILYADSGLIVTGIGDSPASIQAYEVGRGGNMKRILDYQADYGRLAGEPVMNPSRSRLACLNAPNPDSFERELHIVSAEEGGERVIAGLDIGQGIETSIKEYRWIDNDRLLITLRENWAGQETASMWILDLRAKAKGDDGGSGSEAAERDTARETDMAKPRGDWTMAEAYMTLLNQVYENSPEINGDEGELRRVALDTSDMLWLTAGEKEALLGMIAEKWRVEALDKTYTQLRDEGLLEEDGSFADGILFKITGGYCQNNLMTADVSKWRAENMQLVLSAVTLRFANDGWSAAK